jgi:hypothetical protein
MICSGFFVCGFWKKAYLYGCFACSENSKQKGSNCKFEPARGGLFFVGFGGTGGASEALMSEKQEGDYITAYDTEKNTTTQAKISKIRRSFTSAFTRLWIAGTMLSVTPAHALQTWQISLFA